jgi:hypothetical protein
MIGDPFTELRVQHLPISHLERSLVHLCHDANRHHIHNETIPFAQIATHPACFHKKSRWYFPF